MELLDNDSDDGHSNDGGGWSSGWGTVASVSFVGYTIGGSYLAVQEFGLIALLLTPLIALASGVGAIVTALVFILLFLVCGGLSLIPIFFVFGLVSLVR